MDKYKYWDEDVENEVNQASMGNANVIEIQFKTRIGAFNIHKNDVVHLANLFRLNIYKSDSKL